MWRLLMLFLSAAALVAVTAGVALAETVYIEDFEDDAGNPAFDPMFEHQIEANPYLSRPPHGQLAKSPLSPEHGIVLSLGTAQDTISFSLLPGQEIVYASVDAQTWGGGGAWDSIDFIGRDDTLRVLVTFNSVDNKWNTIEASADQIGPIQEIQTRASEGYFDNVTIRVVPEPSLIAMAVISAAFCLASRLTNRQSVK